MGSPMLNTALKAARAACTILNRAADNLSTLEVHKKGHSDFVSEADVACERAIVEVLRDAYPRHQILGEENGVIGPHKKVNSNGSSIRLTAPRISFTASRSTLFPSR